METENPQAARHVNQIPVGDLAKIIEALKNIKPDGRQPVSAAAAIKGALKKPIKSALKRGVSYAQLVALLRELGVELTTETLKGYMRESGKPASADQTEAKMDATKAPQTSEPAVIPAVPAEPLIAVNPSGSGTPEMMMSAGAPLPQPSAHQTGTV
ncbi:hypothetical protein [Rhodobacter capsulatus]|jgi:hypothetical protein|uniref:Conserved domain protein n=1 Tax=Rhodobacter capsulatus (strain ATCC BAA-309 / NBRC 16581 / SB1003) TaxID=272942 RepID=D5ASE8_RHOCB|nr:hypothetical protein [Rhodobacter capsulatus]ADE85039.1 conserved domain protein [Rhodobacter capsulatus SB 1003]ETD02168.1 hypothetical protein U714_07640 [Rhodobacter capsulatus DE442]ETD77858.1 hypothetical protein U717_07815 [Rhodobacter capsulatus R121]ETE54200.1 hypothetical protein U715_07810 [Rhodobacter capsulatus Y262]MDS0926693.1 hypothetical protein [Rhodobacter capsulatus]